MEERALAQTFMCVRGVYCVVCCVCLANNNCRLCVRFESSNYSGVTFASSSLFLYFRYADCEWGKNYLRTGDFNSKRIFSFPTSNAFRFFFAQRINIKCDFCPLEIHFKCSTVFRVVRRMQDTGCCCVKRFVKNKFVFQQRS